MTDYQKIRRESMRWSLLLALNYGRPYTTHEQVLLDTARGLWGDATQHEVRRELDYLADRKLVDIVREPSGSWYVDISRYGVDVVEYAVDCEPGIARPVKYGDS